MNENTLDKKGILLETGTNEFEIVEFNVGLVNYGINVAKVREVINVVEVTKMPQSHPYVDGMFTLRGRVMPLVNLARCLGEKDETTSKNIIVSELNNYHVGFLVDGVSRIHRVSWTEMEPPPIIGNSSMVVGIIKMANKMVLLLDFEKIIADINPDMNMKLTTIPEKSQDIKEQRSRKSILLAEDSPMLRELLVDTLHEAGYKNITAYHNGKEAWEALANMAQSDTPVEEKIQIIITDIEMPQMDGHHLLKKIREDQKLAKMPVVIFSSLINEEMRRKGDAIGANGQISKPEIGQLIELIDRFVLA